MEFEVSTEVAEKALAKCDELLEVPLDKERPIVDEPNAYTRGVKDTLGWLLGYYDPPDCFDEDIDEGEGDGRWRT